MEKGVLIGFFIIVALANFVSAEILISSVQDVYNLGDEINVDATIKRSIETNDFFQLYLICEGNEWEFHKQYILLSPGEEKKININFVLLRDLVGASEGECVIKGTLGSEATLSEAFKLSNKLYLNYTIEKEEYNPGEDIIIMGNVVKENGQPVDGFIELNAIEENIRVTNTINSGNFFINFSFPKDTKAIQYLLHINAYEKDSKDNRSNSGFINKFIKINQIPTRLEFTFDSQETLPGKEFRFKPVLFDQAGDEIYAEGIYTVKDTNGKIIEQIKGNTGEFISFAINNQSMPGIWKLFGIVSGVDNERVFEVLKNQVAYFSLINNTLYIYNTGNVPYNKTVLVKIGENSENIPLNLDIGLSTIYTLQAPPGNYSVKVSDGNSEVTSGNVALTGNAVAVRQGSGAGAFSSPRRSFATLFLILIFGMFGMMLLRRSKTEDNAGYNDNSKHKKTNIDFVDSVKKAKNKEVDLSGKGPLASAEYVLNIKGERQESIILCLGIKNKNELDVGEGSNLPEFIDRMMRLAADKKAVLYSLNNYMFFLFIPSITRTFKNEDKAVDLAFEFKNMIIEYNKKFKNKMQWNIAINKGPLIVQSGRDGVKFSAINSLIPMTKKLVDNGLEELYLSGEIGRKGISGLKSEKVQKETVDAYRVRERVDKSENKQFIDKFLSRNSRR
jgi:hypothetical protein